MFNYVIANKEWIFSGVGVAAIMLVWAWLRKKFFPTNPPQSISALPPIEVQLLPPKKEEQVAVEPNSEAGGIIRKFNTVLCLMNQRRTYHNYTIARLAQIMQLHSVGQLESVFLGRCEPDFNLIDHFCRYFGINKRWLIDGESTPFINNDQQHLMPLDYLDEIKLSNPERIFFIMCNSPVREAFIVLKFSDWRYKILHYIWHISDHVGGTGQAQIFSMYCLIKALEKEGLSSKCSGRMLDEKTFRELFNGKVFPWGVLESPNCYSNYWWHDFADVYHEFPIAVNYEAKYGQGFMYAQSIVRYELEEHEKWKAANPSLHKICTTCLALSSREHNCIL